MDSGWELKPPPNVPSAPPSVVKRFTTFEVYPVTYSLPVASAPSNAIPVVIDELFAVLSELFSVPPGSRHWTVLLPTPTNTSPTEKESAAPAGLTASDAGIVRQSRTAMRASAWATIEPLPSLPMTPRSSH
jgi:hypothetical protein